MQEAMLYSQLDADRVRCRLCSHHCTLTDGQLGVCGVRENRDGRLYSLVYGRSVATNVDPIEKKPLFHLQPGSKSFSLATVGCNFRCRHCQNWQIAQYPQLQPGEIPGQALSPKTIVDQAMAAGCASIAYTYTEPTIFYEYAFDTAKLANTAGIKNIFVSNGYTSGEALRTIAPFLDAANIDLKSFSDDFYRKVCGARLQPVLDTIRLYRQLGIWIEVTTLIIPGYNDGDEELRQIAEFICSVGEDIPWHVSAFYPTHKLLDAPRTPAKTLQRARQIGFDAGLRYVYQGNIPGEGGENSYCHACGELLIERYGFSIQENRLKDGRCSCGAVFSGVSC
ncbi:pyruvate formate lyase activating enzyme [Malonomonas rubra DSM 5091]|uniref:Pyruvate formate lyase activating enzyme n=1 Tax=Malonomonas rubra DSM 5091 TaxID=1122189 RepID=A0A1M6EXN9_MALRU|nr:AmmeMemoRadiSam system radical SAM enzyme [Malonomonas rubra]SHI90195.1 pyruvate formate lyase activating enzyme [Malonomonas rubra DSM 5091]